MEDLGGSAAPERARWVHVGGAYLYVDRRNRLAEEAAPAPERARAEKLAQALADIRDEGTALAVLDEAIAGAERATGSAETFGSIVDQLAHGPDSEELAKLADSVIERVLHDYREGRLGDVVKLVRNVLAVYLLVERWRDLVSLLHLARDAAERIGEAGEAAAALNDLGVLADAAGNGPLAAELFEQAHDLFEQSGDHVAAEAAAQGGLGAPAASTGVAVGVKVAAAVAGAVIVAGGAAGFAVGDGWYGLGGSDRPAREGGDAEILWFSAGDEQVPPGAFSEQAGYSRPPNAVGPGDTLGACEPLYVYDYTRFSDMVAETPYATRMTRGDEIRAVSSGNWAGPVEFVEGTQTYRGPAASGVSNGEPVPYGEWELVVEIDGVEVDRETFTLEEDC